MHQSVQISVNSPVQSPVHESRVQVLHLPHPETSDRDTIELHDESDGSYSFSDEEQELELSDVETDDQHSEFSYTLKLVNPNCNLEFQTIKFGNEKEFKSSLQQFMYKTISTNPKFRAPDMKSVEMGYIESVHDLRGTKIRMCGDGDVEMMNDYFKKSKSILWCYTEADTKAAKKKKVGASTSKSTSGTNMDSIWKIER